MTSSPTLWADLENGSGEGGTAARADGLRQGRKTGEGAVSEQGRNRDARQFAARSDQIKGWNFDGEKLDRNDLRLSDLRFSESA